MAASVLPHRARIGRTQPPPVNHMVSMPRPHSANRRAALIIATLSLLFGSAAGADYLNDDLRRSVDALKAAYRSEPTTQASYAGRASVAWQWVNAYARTGKPLPVNITTAVRPVPARRPTNGNLRAFDFFLAELTLLDEEPTALGELSADLGPFEARTYVTLEQRYVVGSRAVRPGGGFLIARHFQPGYGAYQPNNPTGDNYVTISSSNPEVVFTVDSRPLAGMHGGFRGARQMLFFAVESGVLEPDDVVTITYGDKSQGGRGWLMGFASTDFLPVPIYVDLDGDGHAYALPIQPVRVIGTEIAGVHGFAPSVVRPGERFELSVRAEDRFFNRATGPLPAFTVFANDRQIGAIEASQEAIHVLGDLAFEDEGVYRIRIVSDDGRIQGVGNPILVSHDANRVFWGDTHGHSGFAEGIGTPDRFMQWAKDDARLDFVTHSEHDIWMDDYEWAVLRANVARYSEPGKFIGYLGYEWTTQNFFGGHHNVLFRDLETRERIPNQEYPTLSELYAGLRAHYDTDDVLVIPHAHQAGDYRLSDPALEPLVEIMSQHGTFEWFGRAYLSHRHHVGFIAASDNHLSQPGYTSVGGFTQRGGLAAVLADRLGRDAIFDAMKRRATYATTGDKIILDVTVNDVAMGARAPFEENRVISGRVIGTGPIDSITLVKNGVDIWTESYRVVPTGRFADEETFIVEFQSPTFPMHPFDNPRGVRAWNGTLTVSDAEIVGFRGSDFFNVETNRLERDPADPNRLLLRTRTRGDFSSIELKLKGVSRRTKVVVSTVDALERGSPTRFRPAGRTPASELEFAVRDLVDGRLRQVVPLDGYEDAVTLRRVPVDGVDDVTFRTTDVSFLQGDYYYLRVRQANDAMAWSSPTWVGGFPPR